MNPTRRRTRLIVLAVGLLVGLGSLVAFSSATATAPAERAAGKFRIDFSTSAKNAEVGDRVTLRGTVKPARRANKKKVRIQQRVDGGWTTITKRRVRKGKFRYRLRVSAPGAAKYRAVMPRVGKQRRGVSKRVRVTGYRWRYLSEMDWFLDNDWDPGPAVINGQDYPESVWEDNISSGTMEINLDGRCVALRGVAGLTNESDSGSRGSLSIRSDGTEIYTNTALTMTTTDELDLDIRGTLRLTLTSERLSDGLYPEVGIGDARVYCRS